MIKVIPFEYVNAMTDIEDGVIYLSSKLSEDDLEDVMIDEFAHLISKDPTHGEQWKEICEKIYGKVPKHNAKYDEEFSRISAKISANIGNITGIHNMLMDYHLLQAYRKFASKVLATEGSWEIVYEEDGKSKILLKPTPKAAFPVVIRYLPSIDTFNLPAAQELCSRALIAEASIILGHTRRKMANLQGPDGGNLGLDGDALVQQGENDLKEIVEKAISYGEPLGFIST